MNLELAKVTNDKYLELIPPILTQVLMDAGDVSAVDAKRKGTYRTADVVLSFDRTNPEAVKWAATESSKKITEVTENQKTTVREIISHSIIEGVPPKVAAREIKQHIPLLPKHWNTLVRANNKLKKVKPETLVKIGKRIYRAPKEGFSEERRKTILDRYETRLHNYRAQMIARTETIAAANEGQRQLWLQAKQNGLLTGLERREWIQTGDARTCQFCIDMSGQTAPIDKPFTGPNGPVMGPPLHPMCRCAVGLTKDKAKWPKAKAFWDVPKWAPEYLPPPQGLKPDGKPVVPKLIKPKPIVPEPVEPKEKVSTVLGIEDEEFLIIESGKISPTDYETLDDAGVNLSLVVTVEGPEGEELKAIYKPDDGVDTYVFKWTDDTLSPGQKEALAYQIDQLLDLGIVPPTYYNEEGIPGKTFIHHKQGEVDLAGGSVQMWADGYNAGYKFLPRSQEKYIGEMGERIKLHLLDLVIGNTDRHLGNVLTNEEEGSFGGWSPGNPEIFYGRRNQKIAAIDNGGSFEAPGYGGRDRFGMNGRRGFRQETRLYKPADPYSYGGEAYEAMDTHIEALQSEFGGMLRDIADRLESDEFHDLLKNSGLNDAEMDAAFNRIDWIDEQIRNDNLIRRMVENPTNPMEGAE
jgi:SPP1 gp7 family putative phage head morphogenesis protein